MDRSERHRLRKRITKRLEYLEKHTALADRKMINLPKEDKKLLAENNHPDKELQSKFNAIPNLLKEYVELQGRLVGLSNMQKELP
jgi:hypothetical protein